MRLAVSLLFGLLVSTGSLAYSGGNPHTNCAACHTGGATPTVQFLVNGVATTSLHVQRGDTLQLAFAVNSPTAIRARFSVRTLLGSITPGSGQHYHTGTTDITQDAPKALAGGIVTFPFSLTTSGSVACGSVGTLQGWGSAVNGNGAASGDGNQQTGLTFTVDCPAEPIATAPTTTLITNIPKLSPVLMLGQREASDLLMAFLRSANYYRAATSLLVPANARSQDQNWMFDVVVQNCPSTLVDTWRVDTVTKGITRLASDGKFVLP